MPQFECEAIIQLTSRSNHPASRRIFQYLDTHQKQFDLNLDLSNKNITNWEEVIGKGVQGKIDSHYYKLGSKSFMPVQLHNECVEKGAVYFMIDNHIRGYFIMDNLFREGTWQVLSYFRKKGNIYLLSGDTE